MGNFEILTDRDFYLGLNRYFEWGNACRRCSKVSTYVLPLLVLLGILFLVTVVLNDDWDASKADSVVRINILISYSQVLGRLNYYGIDWTREMSSALGMFDYSNVGAKLTSPRCLESGANFYDTFLIAMAVPAAVVASYGTWYIIKLAQLRRRGRAMKGERGGQGGSGRRGIEAGAILVEARTYCCRCILFLLTLVYISIASAPFEVFGTRQIDDKHYLQSDYDIVVREPSGKYVFSPPLPPHTFSSFPPLSLLL